jgi:hypothetical protein
MAGDDTQVSIETTVSPGPDDESLTVTVQDPTVATYMHAAEETRKTINHQIQWNAEIDDKAARLLRINIALATIVVTLLSVLLQYASDSTATPSGLFTVGGVPKWFLIAGSFCFAVSTLMAGVTYTRSKLFAGIKSDDVQAAIDDDLDLVDFYEKLAKGYKKWEKINRHRVERNGKYLTVSITFVLYALVLLGGGLAAGFGLDISAPTLAVVLVVGVTYAVRYQPPNQQFNTEEEE